MFDEIYEAIASQAVITDPFVGVQKLVKIIRYE